MGIVPVMTRPAVNTIEVELDSRQRLPMARIIQGSHHRFRVIDLGNGEYLISPVVTISERELAMLRNPEAMASLTKGMRQAAEGAVTRRGSGYYEKLVAQLEPDED